jgi:hypothetical protein
MKTNFFSALAIKFHLICAAGLALLFGVIVAPPRAHAIVISQVYGGGGNAIGSPFTNDFIELFNNGTTSQSLTGWSVQYASDVGSFSQVTTLSGSVGLGQYFLIQEHAGAGGFGSPLPPSDVTGNIDLSATNGKVALVNTTTALSCGITPCSPSALANVVDLVGYGSTANLFEGAGPAPSPSNTTAVIRAAGGYAETNDNAFDFTAGSPNPRNSASPLNPLPQVPLPGAFPLFGTGLGALGLLGWRRKRKIRAA